MKTKVGATICVVAVEGCLPARCWTIGRRMGGKAGRGWRKAEPGLSEDEEPEANELAARRPLVENEKE